MNDNIIKTFFFYIMMFNLIGHIRSNKVFNFNLIHLNENRYFVYIFYSDLTYNIYFLHTNNTDILYRI